MPNLNVTTKAAKQIWKSPDGQRTIYELTMDYKGQAVKAKTYSDQIATIGWSGEVESYEKSSRNGLETFVRQTPKEGGPRSGGGSTRPSYQPKDEKAIQAMWAIGQASQALGNAPIEEIEVRAQELFAMVPRVKASENAMDASTTPNEPETPVEPDVVHNPDEVDIADIFEDAQVIAEKAEGEDVWKPKA